MKELNKQNLEKFIDKKIVTKKIDDLSDSSDDSYIKAINAKYDLKKKAFGKNN